MIGAGGVLAASGGVAHAERITYVGEAGDCTERISGIDANGDGALSASETDYHTLTCREITEMVVYRL